MLNRVSPVPQFRPSVESSRSAPSFSRTSMLQSMLSARARKAESSPLQSMLAARARSAESSPKVEIAFKGPALVKTPEIAPSSTSAEKQMKVSDQISYRSAP